MCCIPVHTGHETSTHYFSCSGGPIAVSIKSAPGHVTPNLCFCIRWDLRVTQCIPVYPGHNTSIHYFHAWVGPLRIKKKCAGKSYTEIVFLPPVGYASHVVHSSASWAQNVNAVFFMLGWAQCGFHKKCILVHPRHETSMHHFSSSGGPDAVSIKSAPVHIT
jgi:hypothetical protein